MRSIRNFHDQTEAQMAASLLIANGIEAQTVGSRDYSSHIVGGTQGAYQLMVPDHQEAEARQILTQTHLMHAEDIRPHKNYLGRAIFFACAAIVFLPVIFNIVSLLNAKTYWDYSAKDSKAVWRMLLLLALQVPGLTIAVIFLRSGLLGIL